jgi:FixJ family two-component response regulator
VPEEPKIAVIDDDDSLRVALVDSLSSRGFGADGYSSGESFISTAANRSYDCVVTDIHMSGMSGLELVQWLEARGSLIPVILVTANTEAILETAGAAGLLRKPFEIDDLIKCIENAL